MTLVLTLLILFSTNALADTIDLNAIVIHASRSDDSLSAMSQSVDVITREDILASPAKSLPELMGTKVGVNGLQFGNIKSAQVDIRGFGENAATNVLILVDGRRTNQIDLSGQDWAYLDLASIERVEIIRGPGSVLYGDNASGGIINIVTLKGKSRARPSLTLESSYGSYQTSHHGMSLLGGTPHVGYGVNYQHTQTTGYRANSDFWANDLNTQVTLTPNDTVGIDMTQGYHLDRYQLPGALFPMDIQQLGRRGVRSALANDHGWTSDQHYDVTPRMKFDLGGSDGEVSLLGSARRRSNKFFTGNTVYETAYLTDSYEMQPKVVLVTPWGDHENKMTAGYDFFYAKNRRRSGYLASAQDLVYIRKVTHGAYLVDELSLDDHWLVNAGARKSWARYGFDQHAVVAAQESRSPQNQGYEAGLGYRYHPESKVYVTYDRSYRWPAVDEFYQNMYDFGGGITGGGLNKELVSQTGHHYEIGVQDHSIKDIKAGVSVYLSDFKHEIYLDPASFMNTNYNGTTRHYGVETQASVELCDGKLAPFANWSLQEARFKKGSYDGKEIPFVPDQLFNYGITYHPTDRVSMALMFKTVGEAFAISDVNNTQPKLKRTTTADLNFSYAFNQVEVWFSLMNIFDKQYYAYGAYSPFANDTGYYPAPTRHVSTGVKVKF